MSKCKNRGKFPGRIGRPKKSELAALEALEKKNHPMLPREELLKLAAQDIREVDADSIAEFSDLTLPEDLPLWEWMVALVTQSGNPYVFKQDGYLFRI